MCSANAIAMAPVLGHLLMLIAWRTRSTNAHGEVATSFLHRYRRQPRTAFTRDKLLTARLEKVCSNDAPIQRSH